MVATLQANATHIVGGSMFYEHLGGSSYLVSIRLYKDCSEFPFTSPFSNTVKVQIRRGDGTSPAVSSVDLPLLAIDTLDPEIDTCAFNPGVCVSLGVFSKIVNLPPQVGGYHLFYTDCCRNASVANIVSPSNWNTGGSALHTYIPDNNIYITNSSPVFTQYPPVYVCRNQDLNFDFSATDSDGDSLAYSLIKPYRGLNEYSGTPPSPAYSSTFPTINSTGTAPDNITFFTISYLPGYSSSNPLNSTSGNGLTISSAGLLTGSPEVIGQYLVAVKVDEFRNGLKIGTIVRDFQYNVLDCPPLKDAAIGDIDVCSGLNVQMINESGAGANGFWWDFGTGNPADTSNLESPSFTYPSNGIYNLTLMAQKGTLCADTAYLEMKLSNVNGQFTSLDTLCLNEEGTYTSTSFSSSNDIIDYIAWDFDSNLDTGSTVEYTFTSSGDFQVQMIVGSENGCMDTVNKSIHVKTPPVADFSPSIGCNSQSLQFTNQSSANASGFWWDFGTGLIGDTSDLASPLFTFPTFGSFPVTFITQKGTECADTIVKNVGLYDVQADFQMPDTICKNEVITFLDESLVNNTSILNWEWTFGTFASSALQSPDQNFSSIGTFPVKLVVVSASGCTDTIIKQLTVVEIPSAQFIPDDLCSGLNVSFTNQSGAGATNYHWNFGTGQSADTSFAIDPSFTFPAYGTYNVTLNVNSSSACNATISQQINVSNVQADFSVQDTACIFTSVPFTDQSLASSTLTLWHWNFDDFNTSVSQNNFHNYNAAGIYDVQLIVFASDGCTDTIVKTVEILAQPIVNGGIDTAMCISDPSITLTGASQHSGGIIWTHNGGGILPNDTSPTITYTPNSTEINSGETFVVLNSALNPYCPAVSDTVWIDIIEIPDVTTISDFAICEDQSPIAIDGVVLNTSQFEWTTTGTGTIVNQNLLSTAYSPSIQDLVNGSVDLVLSSLNDYGCDNDEDTLSITFAPLPVANISALDTICFLESIDLISNSNTGNGVWQTIGDGYFLPSDTGATTTYYTGIIDSDLGYATLIFESLNNNSCAATNDTIVVTILPFPEAEIGTIISCVGNESQIINLTNYDEPIVNLTWYIGDSTYYGDSIGHEFPNSGFFDVTVVLVSESGCKDSTVLPIKVNDLPVADFVSPEPCVYGAVFADSSYADSTSIVSWLWHFGDGDSSMAQNPIHTYDTLGTYAVDLEVVSGFGCLGNVSYQVPIFPPPVSQFTFFPNPAQVSDEVSFNSDAYSINAPIVEWFWNFGNGDSSDLIDPKTIYETGGLYVVSLVVFDGVGCRDTSFETVFISHGPKVPNAFTPDGDGLNDYLMILGSGFEAIDFTIYNNWGRVLYHTEDVNDKGWDGTFEGEPQPMGVYVYKAWVKNVYGEEIEISGDATIIK
ncbi:MAG: PKD domain-containing protein [Crocinitomicaceae bacterium]